MSYTVEFTRKARRQFAKLTKDVQQRVVDRATALDELRIFRVEGPENAKLLSRGDDLFPVRYTLEVAEYVAEGEYHTHRESGICEMSWNRIISAIGPRILVPMNESDIRASLSHTILKKVSKNELWNLWIDDDDFQTIKIQLRALGILEVSDEKWSLTDYGDHLVTNLMAIPKEAAQPGLNH